MAWLALGLLGLVLLVVLSVLVALQTDWGRDRLRLFALERLRGMVQGRVDVARLGGDFLHGIALDGITITGPAGEPLLSVKRFEIDYDVGGFLRRELLFGDILLVEPRIHLVQDSTGQWNYERILPFLAGPEEPKPPKPPGGWGSVVRIDELRVMEGAASVMTRAPGRSFGPLGRAAEIHGLNGKLGLELAARGGEDRKHVEAEDVSFVVDEPRLTVRELDARATVTPEGIDLERLLVRTPSSELSGEGKVRNPAAPVLDVTFRADPLALGEVRPFAAAVPFDGTVRGTVKATGPADSLEVALRDFVLQTARSRVQAQGTLEIGASPVVEGELVLAPLDPADARAAFAAYPLEEALRGRVSAQGTRRRTEIDGEVAFGTTTAAVEGTVGYEGQEPAYDVRLSVARLDAEDFLHDPVWRSNVNARLHVAGTGLGTQGNVALEGSLEDTRIRGYRIRSASLEGRLQQGVFRLQDFRLALARSQVRGSGVIPLEGPLNIQVSATSRDLGDFYPAGGQMPVERFETRATVTGPRAAPNARVTVRASSLAARGYVIGALEASAVVTGAGTPAMRAVVDGAVRGVASEGQAVLRSGRLEARMAGQMLGATLALEVDSLRSAEAHARIGLGGPAPTVVLDRASLASGGQVWSLEPGGRLVYGDGGLRFDGFALSHDGQRVALDGKLSLKGRQDLRFELENLSLADLQTLAGLEPQATGVLAGSGTIGGTERAPVLRSELSLTGADVGGVGIRRVDARLDYAERRLDLNIEAIPGARSVVAPSTGEGPRSGEAPPGGKGPEVGSLVLSGAAPVDLAFGPVAERFPDRPLDLRLESRDLQLAVLQPAPPAGGAPATSRQVSGVLDLDLRLTGRPSAPILEGRFALSDARSGGVAVDRLSGTASYAARELRLDAGLVPRAQVAGGGEAGSLSLSGIVPVDLAFSRPVAKRFPDQPVDLRVQSRNFNLALLRPAAEEGEPLSGALEFDLRLGGRPSAPVLESRLGLRDARFGGVVIDRLDGQVDYADRELRLDVEVAPGVPGPAGEAPGPAVATAKPATAAGKNETGAGGARETGSTPAGAATLQGAGLLAVRGTFPVDLSLEPVARRVPDRPVEVRVQSQGLTLRLLESLSPRIREASGPVQLDVHLTGTPSNPRYEGQIAVRDGAFRMGPNGPRYSRINGTVSFDNDLVSFQDVRVASVGGEARLDGRIAVRELTLGEIQASLQARRFTLLDEDGRQLIVDAGLQFAGTTQAPSIAGKLNVDQMRWPIPEQSDKDVIDVDQAILYVRPEGEAPAKPPPADVFRQTFMDVDVTIEDDAILRNNKTFIVLEGDVSIDKARGADRPSLAGTIDVVRGFYADFGKRFEVKEGEVTFYGTPELNPALNVVAVTTVTNSETGQDVQVTLTLGGTVQRPTLDVSSTPEYEKSEIFSLLLFGTTTPGQGEQRRFEETMTRVAARQAAGPLQRALASELGLDILEIQPGVGAEGTTVRVGKYIASDVFVTYTQTPAPQQENQLGLEYRLSRKWTLATQAGSRQFGGDIFYQFQY